MKGNHPREVQRPTENTAKATLVQLSPPTNTRADLNKPVGGFPPVSGREDGGEAAPASPEEHSAKDAQPPARHSLACPAASADTLAGGRGDAEPSSGPAGGQAPAARSAGAASASPPGAVPPAAPRPSPPSAGSAGAPRKGWPAPAAGRGAALAGQPPARPPLRPEGAPQGAAPAEGRGPRPAGSPRGLRALVSRRTRLPQPLRWLLLLTHPPRRLCSTAAGCLAAGAAGLSGAGSLFSWPSLFCGSGKGARELRRRPLGERRVIFRLYALRCQTGHHLTLGRDCLPAPDAASDAHAHESTAGRASGWKEKVGHDRGESMTGIVVLGRGGVWFPGCGAASR